LNVSPARRTDLPVPHRLVYVLVLLIACGRTAATPSASPRATSSAARVASTNDAELAKRIDTYVAAFGKHWGEASAFHGYVAVARDGTLVFGKAYGKADREHGITADADTRFRIGSITKSFTALGVLQLEEKGLLRIDDSIRKHLPELPLFTDAITLRHCLTHTSGLPALPDDEALVVESGNPHPMAAVFASLKTATPRFPAGERFEYSNGGYSILAAVLERVSGQSYEAYFREHVFGPAGMTRTTTVNVPSASDMAVGYAVGERDDITVAPPISYVTFGAGAIISTATDLVAWDRALSGTGLLSEPTKRRMWTPDRDMGAIVSTPTRYALGWMVSRSESHDVFWHLGGVDGFETSFARIPDARVTVVVLSNLSGSPNVLRGVANAAQDMAVNGKARPPVDERVIEPINDSQAAALAGEYAMDAQSVAAIRAKLPREIVEAFAGLTVTADHGRVFLKFFGPPTVELFRGGDGTLFTKHTGMEVVPEARGAEATPWLTVSTEKNGGPLHARYARLATALAAAADGVSCPAGMVRLAGGSAPFDASVAVAPFCFDVTEVTVAAYAKCVRSGMCAPAPTTAAWNGISDMQRAKWSPSCNGSRTDRQNHPINCVDWSQAMVFCRALAKRLPTAEEWEWAASGGEEGRVYPWGYAAPTSQLCWSGVGAREGTCAVGSFPASDARGGIHDLAGNVFEWTSSTAGTADRVQKGGAWTTRDPGGVQGAGRVEGEAAFRGPTVGLRCAK
jgi:CubicO group peptidase (beta-lactamase class C family)